MISMSRLAQPASQSHFPLIHILNPGLQSRRLRLFNSLNSIRSHIRGHMLSRGECRLWRLANTEFDELVSSASQDEAQARYLISKQLNWDIDLVQQLYRLYAEVVQAALEDAAELGWWAEGPTATVAMGHSGLLVIADQLVRTAYFPGYTDSSEIGPGPDAISPERKHPREQIRTHGDHIKLSSGERSSQSRREALWSDDRKRYEHGFRRSVSYIRSVDDGVVLFGASNSRRRNIAGLNQVLPRRSESKFDHWIAMRDVLDQHQLVA